MGLTKALWDAHHQSLLADVSFTRICRLALVLVQHVCACADRAAFRQALAALQAIRDQGVSVSIVELLSRESNTEDEEAILVVEEEYAPPVEVATAATAAMQIKYRE
jgi:hypothetical protein